MFKTTNLPQKIIHKSAFLGGVEQGDPPAIPGLRRCPESERKAYPLQYSGLENSKDCYSPWGYKESDMTERLSLSQNNVGEGYLCATLLKI